MSIHHQVSIHCNACGTWEHGDDRTTRQRRKAGWLIWRTFSGAGRWAHLCPDCALDPAARAKVREWDDPELPGP